MSRVLFSGISTHLVPASIAQDQAGDKTENTERDRHSVVKVHPLSGVPGRVNKSFSDLTDGFPAQRLTTP